MDLKNEYLELQPEPDSGYENSVTVAADTLPASSSSTTYDDAESSQVPRAGAGRGKKARNGPQGGHNLENPYETPNVYAEIPNLEYESLEHEQRNPEHTTSIPPQPSTPNTRPALPGEPQPQPQLCCKKSARFWCLVTTAMSTVIVVLVVVVVVLTGIDFENTFGYLPL